MSRTETRAKRRVARFDRSRDNPEDFEREARRLANSPQGVWAIAKTLKRPLDDEEKDIVSEAVAPHLVRMTPGTVRRRIVKDLEGKLLRNIVREAMAASSDVECQLAHYRERIERTRDDLYEAIASSPDTKDHHRERAKASLAEFSFRKQEVESGEFDESDAT